MRILGIDPGYDRLGIAVLEKPTKGKENLVYSSCFTTSSKTSGTPKSTIYDRLESIGTEIARVIEEFKPTTLAIETLFITKNQKTAMRVSEARGIIMYEAIKHSIPVYEYSPMQIKLAVTSDGTSDKTRMTKMVKILVALDKSPRLDDEYDAIAVALAHSAIHSSPLLPK